MQSRLHRRNLHNSRTCTHRRLSLEVLEDRHTPAYPIFTPLSGTSNPFNGFNVGGFTSTPALGDLDGNGTLDLVAGGHHGTLHYFKNMGTMDAPHFVQQTGANNPFNGIDVGSYSHPALADVDGNGTLDLVVGHSDSNSLRYFKNVGTATAPSFGQQFGANNPFNGISTDLPSRRVPELADVDGNGTVDLLLGQSEGILRYFKNVGTATAPSFVEQTGANNPFGGIAGLYASPMLADVDRDGAVDLVLGGNAGFLVYFRNTGTRTSPAFTHQGGSANPFNGVSFVGNSAPALGDWNGDGQLDLVVGDVYGNFAAFRNDAVPPAYSLVDQSNASSVAGVNVGSQAAPAFGDLDGDGDLDLFVAGAHETSYYENTGTATAPAYQIRSGSANPMGGIDFRDKSAPVFADLDGDGDLDLIVGDIWGEIRYFKNVGSKTIPQFQRQTGPDNPFETIYVGDAAKPTLGDVDGDGDLDLLIGSDSYGSFYFENVGSRTNPIFVQQTEENNPFQSIGYSQPFPPLLVWSPSLVDLDSDGLLDLVVGEYSTWLQYYRNIGTATNPVFAAPSAFGNVLTQPMVTFADLDGDGDLDSISGRYEGTLAYFRNNRAPVVNAPLADQTFTGPGVKSYTVTADAFLDLDRDTLTYTATLANGEELPSWLTFTAATRTFSGNPEPDDDSPLQVRVTATDPSGQSVFDDFQLTLSNVGEPEAPSLVVTIATDVVDAFDYQTSLREAIAFAKVNPGPDTITFGDGSASGGTNFLDGTADTITLTLGELALTDAAGVTIIGPGAGLLSVSGGGASRLFRVTGAATISGLTVTGGNAGNSSGGGILVQGGSLALANATVANNGAGGGGGVFIRDGSLNLINATVANNTAGSGGGVYVRGGTVNLINATVANNNSAEGGGVYARESMVTLTNATVANNTAVVVGGVYVESGTVRLRSSLIVGNAAFSSPEVYGTLAEQSSSLVGVPQGYTLAQVVQVDGDGRPLLADNGGPTRTIALVPGSPAINAGNNALAVDTDNQPLTTDQRGTGFARLVGTVDIGAFEVQNSAPTVGHDQATVAVNEGSLATNSGTFDDAQGRGTVTLSASLGTVTQNDVNGTWSWSYTPADDLATPATVTISATDNGNLVETTTFTLSVANVLPTVAILGESSVPQGLVYSLTLGTVLDPGDDTVSQYVVHWGDGTSNTYSSAGIKTHLYATVGNFPITVDLVDEDGTHLNRGNALSVQVSPLQISIARIDKGLSNQRSMVRSLTVTLSSAVNAAQATAILSGLSLTGATGVTLNGSLQAGGTELKITFAESTIVGGSLADGRYVLRYGSEEVGSFHRLFGDLNGNARVDSEDASIMRSIRNGTRSNSVAYNEYLDFDANAVITIADRDQFNRRVGISV